mmetsp:Transcript_63406/g.95711  ORF Transcript_63406/g.95711 Transcript_63406/m.95711 type:complete len:209 (+) Transcript_63406:360-986(+)
MANGTILEVLSKSLCGHGSRLIFRFFRRGAQMRQNNGILVIPQFIVGEIGNVSTITLVQKFLHGDRIDKLPTGKVKDDRVRLHMTNDFGSNDSMCSTLSGVAFDVGNVDANIVRIGNRRRDGIGNTDILWQFQCRLDFKTGIVSDQLHTQRPRIHSRSGSDMSQTNHSQRLSRDFSSSKHGLILFDTLPRQSLTSQIFHVVDSVNDAT